MGTPPPPAVNDLVPRQVHPYITPTSQPYVHPPTPGFLPIININNELTVMITPTIPVSLITIIPHSDLEMKITELSVTS